jgi:hypothetical protein
MIYTPHLKYRNGLVPHSLSIVSLALSLAFLLGVLVRLVIPHVVAINHFITINLACNGLA